MKEEDYYINENGKVVFSREYHLRRAYGCGSGCLHCPFEPRHQRGNTNTEKEGTNSNKIEPQ